MNNSVFFPSLRAVLLAASLCAASTAIAQYKYVNFEGKQTRPICLSPDGTLLFAVNTPDTRLSVFDVSHPLNPFLLAEIPVGVEPVSVNARDNNEVWVVNEVSDSISIISVSNKMVVDTLYVKDEPVDVVFAGGKAFVSASRKNQIAVFNVTNHTLVTNITLFGENPRCLAVNTNGTKLYAAFALSGNHTTIIPGDIAPLQSTNGTPPMSPSLPPPPQVSLIVDATNSTWFTDSPRTNFIKFTMPDNDVVEIDVASLAINRYFSRVGTVNLGLAIQPGSGDLFVANTDARNLVHFEPAVRSHTVDNRISRINLGSGAITIYDLNSNLDYNLLPNLPAKTNALAQPTALVFDPSGSFFYVAAFGSDRVAKVAASGAVLARVEICPTAIGSAADPRNKRGPRGLALDSAGQRLYVMNRLANTISIIDTTANTVLKEIPVGSYDPTTATIRQGRGFLYDAKLSGNGTMACAACHIDSEMDLIAWDLGDPTGQMVSNALFLGGVPVGQGTNHPMKGPMTTQTLRGLNTLDPFHWRGDRTNFTHFNVAFPGLLGGSALSTADINAYRDFINTVGFQPNPNQNLDRTYSTNFNGRNAEAGRLAFFNTNYTGSGATGLKCNSCHTGPPGTGSDRLLIPGVAKEEPSNSSAGPQNFKTPHLRNAYQKLNFNNASNAVSIGGFGFVHDGTDRGVFEFLGRNVFDNINNNATIRNNLAAFVESFDTGTAPAVGYTRTVVLTNLATSSVTNDWSLLESQANLTNIDLIVKGTIDGQRHGLVYQRALANYKADTTNLTTFTHAQLYAKVLSGDTLTIMGVPFGSGTRMGIDRDGDGVLDGDVPRPTLLISRGANPPVVNWPFGPAGFQLEEATNLSGAAWSASTGLVEIVNLRNFVTNAPDPGPKFLRLRSR